MSEAYDRELVIIRVTDLVEALNKLHTRALEKGDDAERARINKLIGTLREFVAEEVLT